MAYDSLMSKNTRLVYSTDPRDNQKCDSCKELISECKCTPEVDPNAAPITTVLRIEKGGRGGKTVTVVDRLPKNEAFLKELAGELKKKCGTGGTYAMDRKDGVIEIQGDKRDVIREVLAKKGFKVKG